MKKSFYLIYKTIHNIMPIFDLSQKHIGETSAKVKLLLEQSRGERGCIPCEMMKIDYKLQRLVRKKKWEEAANLAFETRCKALVRFSKIQGSLRASQEWAKARRTSASFMAKQLKKIVTSDKKEVFLAKLKNERARERFKAGEVDFILEAAERHIRQRQKLLGDQLKGLIRIAIVGLVMDFVAQFNKRLASIKQGKISDNELEVISSALEEIESFIILCKRTFYARLIDSDWKNIKLMWLDCVTNIETLLNDLLNKLVLLHSGFNHFLDSNLKREAVSVAKVKLSASYLIRQVFHLYSTAYYLAYLSSQGIDAEETRDEVSRANRLKFQSDIPNWVNVTIRQLLEHPQEYEGKMVEVEGLAKNIEVSRFEIEGKKKFASLFDVTDIVRGESIKVRLYMKAILPEIVAENAYVKINGSFSSQCSWNRKSPGIELDRISFARLRKKSWHDYVTLKVRNWFDLHPSNVNMIWTIEPREEI